MGLGRLLRFSLLAAILAIELCSSREANSTGGIATRCFKCLRRGYRAKWSSLDSRPVPDWYDEAKVGIMVTWGVHSVPGFGPNFWRDWKDTKKPELVEFMRKYYRQGFTYKEFASSFKAEEFRPDDWVGLFKEAGAKYIILSAKENDGYTMFKSKYSPNWNSVDNGPGTDVMNDLSKAVRRQGLRFGMYYSLSEWNHPLYLKDKAAHWRVHNFPKRKVLPELKAAINNFRPDVLWVDNPDNDRDHYWKSRTFLKWLFNKSPIRKSVVVNDRWGGGATCRHGGIGTCYDRKMLDYQTKPKKKWELMLSLDNQSRGFRRNMISDDVLDLKTIVATVIKTVAEGGNILINVGAHRSGTIPMIFQERLLGLGKWLKTNEKAIYGNRGNGKRFKENCQGTEVFYTRKQARRLYGMFTKWPKTNTLTLRNVARFFGRSKRLKVTMLGKEHLSGKTGLSYKYHTRGKFITVTLPQRNETCEEVAWVLRFRRRRRSISSRSLENWIWFTTPKPKKPPIRNTGPPKIAPPNSSFVYFTLNVPTAPCVLLPTSPKPPTGPYQDIFQLFPFPLPKGIPLPKPGQGVDEWARHLLSLEAKDQLSLPDWLRFNLWILLGEKPPATSTNPLPVGVPSSPIGESLEAWAQSVLDSALRDQVVLPDWLRFIILRVLGIRPICGIPYPLPPGVPPPRPGQSLPAWALMVSKLLNERKIVPPKWLYVYILQLLGVTQLPGVPSPIVTVPPTRPHQDILELLPYPPPKGVPPKRPDQSDEDWAMYLLRLEEKGEIALPDWLRFVLNVVLGHKPSSGATLPLPAGVSPPRHDESLQSWAQSVLDDALNDRVMLPNWLRLLILRVLRITPPFGLPYPLPKNVPPPRPGQSLPAWALMVSKLLNERKIVPPKWLYVHILQLLGVTQLPGVPSRIVTVPPTRPHQDILELLPYPLPEGVPPKRPDQSDEDWAMYLLRLEEKGEIALPDWLRFVLTVVLGHKPSSGATLPLPAGVSPPRDDESPQSWAQSVLDDALNDRVILPNWLRLLILRVLRITPPFGLPYPLPKNVPPPRPGQSLPAWALMVSKLLNERKIVLPKWLYVHILQLLGVTQLLGVPAPIVTVPPTRPHQDLLELLPYPLPNGVPTKRPGQSDEEWAMYLLGSEEKGEIALPDWLRFVLTVVLGHKPSSGATLPLPAGVSPPRDDESPQSWAQSVLDDALNDRVILPNWLRLLILRVLRITPPFGLPYPLPINVPPPRPEQSLPAWALMVSKLLNERKIVPPKWLYVHILQLLGVTQLPGVPSPIVTVPPTRPNQDILELLPYPLPNGVPPKRPGQSDEEWAMYLLGSEEKGEIALPDWLRFVLTVVLGHKPSSGATLPLPAGVSPPRDNESLQAWAQSVLDDALNDRVILPNWLRLLILRVMRITPPFGLPYPIPINVPPPRPGQSLKAWAQVIHKLLSKGEIFAPLWLFDIILRLNGFF